MDGLEPVDLYVVRQASFTFWHIYQGKEVEKFRRSEATSRACRTGNFVKDPATVLRARQHAFCSHHEYYQYTKQDEMYCSRCELPYRYLVFSAEERKKRRDVRLCIAHDGFIRLCSHLTVPFSWVWDKTRSKQADSDEARQIRYNYNVFLAAKGCRECEGTDFQDTTTLHHEGAASRWIPLPPTIALYALPRIFDWLRRVMITWELPLFRIVKNEAITVDFIMQKLKEFQTKYGNVFFSHLGRHGITSQLLRALDPRHCGCLGGNSRIGRLVACNEARWGTRDWRRAGGRESSAELLPHSEHKVRCRICPSSYLWGRVGRQIFLSRFSSDFIMVTDEKSSSVTSPLAKLLDPESYRPDSDDTTKYLFWCKDANCRNGKDWAEYTKVL
ncbi:hypothetical protein CPAR01_11110 [Colletotrichum paranaense]|uniref:Integral membrane protein n=1 Tax=Colletotrichum paranaense TaxID=1914294 RepID=A0ABQ9SBT5_9PEZI|nr:uncharacterized protein CPAR01_11110 [Colletotrichum paranaense]KAK1531461.1 hypothetical protein CPAR01_11110 [Colletotrichum paranaense]